ncbi:Mutator mutT protein AltName: Full=7,8-dihydro-8-oxoguanine-triphosphatase [Fibrisoma limi BUZ 3]|uniref:MutX protein n=1 Tax=Fibrisoma limi BUZ 3 TaxID=1185876 RepID=I2GH96_9BACT|nr:NUDIX domain-containing protein [Fibrisoma limi]CCH53271.1 Mutator mutT protein AltName: Full=7,8-dihydro-8-oxoguanine-triphosphatase [Fibrisoma limi BUZ 3]
MSTMSVPVGLKRTAVLCVLRHGTTFLLLKRLKEPNKDQYTPVGGKLDPYESPLQAAYRETWEETGIKADRMTFCGVLTESSPTAYNWTSYVYVAEIDRVPPPPCNEGTLEWIDFADVLNVPTPRTDWFIYDYLLKRRPFAFSAEFDEQLTLLTMREEIEDVVVYQQES